MRGGRRIRAGECVIKAVLYALLYAESVPKGSSIYCCDHLQHAASASTTACGTCNLWQDPQKPPCYKPGMPAFFLVSDGYTAKEEVSSCISSCYRDCKLLLTPCIIHLRETFALAEAAVSNLDAA